MTAAPLLILSYNICLEAMTHKYKPVGHHHFTAAPLGEKCVPVSYGSDQTICARNMSDMVDALLAAMGRANYDFVGLQEAARVDVFIDGAPNTLKYLTPTDSTSGYEDMTSLYDASKYDLVSFIPGEFASGRPFQILVCANKSGAGGVIFINMHYLHPDATKRLTAFDDIANKLSNAYAAAGVPSSAAGYRIIAVGDCNKAGLDASERLVVKSWKPLAQAGVNIDTEVVTTNAPQTCCQPDGVWQDRSGQPRFGSHDADHIFASGGAGADPLIPPNYDFSALCSDHLPVVARL